MKTEASRCGSLNLFGVVTDRIFIKTIYLLVDTGLLGIYAISIGD